MTSDAGSLMHKNLTTDPKVVAQLIDSYFESIIQGNSRVAESVAEVAIARGMDPIGLAIEVFAPALTRVGILWHDGAISTAIEHRATQITSSLIERLRSHVNRISPHNTVAIVTTVEGEQHAIGARIAAELLWQDGWEVDYLGPDTPTRDLVDFALQRQAKLVVIGVSLSEHLDAAAEAIRALKALAPPPPSVLVGGPAVLTPIAPEVLHEADLQVTDLRTLRAAARALIGRAGNQSLESHLEALGNKVVELRKRLALSQTELANLAGIDRTYVSGVERGKQNISLSVLIRIANALGVTIGELLPAGER